MSVSPFQNILIVDFTHVLPGQHAPIISACWERFNQGRTRQKMVSGTEVAQTSNQIAGIRFRQGAGKEALAIDLLSPKDVRSWHFCCQKQMFLSTTCPRQ